jgi:hypothetical protein
MLRMAHTQRVVLQPFVTVRRHSGSGGGFATASSCTPVAHTALSRSLALALSRSRSRSRSLFALLRASHTCNA